MNECTTQIITCTDYRKVTYIIVIRPSIDHYHHLKLYISSTKGTRVTDMYMFIPTKFGLPANVAANRATTAIEEFVAALKTPKEKNTF